jgi:hypothetical protein
MAWIWGMSENKEKGGGERESLLLPLSFCFVFASIIQWERYKGKALDIMGRSWLRQG